jgi:hypothetical protein
MLCKSKLGYRTLIKARGTYRVKVVNGPEVSWMIVVSIQGVLAAPIPIGGLPLLLG